MNPSRLLALAFLGACTAPSLDEGLSEDLAVQEAAPPGMPLSLDIAIMGAGAPLPITISDADPGENVFVGITFSGMGPGPCPGGLGGMCVDIQTPITPLGPFTANALGEVNLSPTVPPGLPPLTEVCFQAIAPRGVGGVDSVKSPVVCRVTANGPVQVWEGANTGDNAVAGWMGGPDLYFGMRHDVTSVMRVGYVEVFTGRGPGGFSGDGMGVHVLSLYSHDAVNNAPGAPLATGSWTMAPNREWQGALLDSTVTLMPGDTVWVVWEPQRGAQVSRDSSGTMVSYRGAFGAPTGWNGPFSNREKYKLCAGGGCP